MPYTITPFTPADLPAVHAFLRAAFTTRGFHFDPNTKDHDLLDIPAHYQSPGGQFLCARPHAPHSENAVATPVAASPLQRAGLPPPPPDDPLPLIATIALRRLPQNTAELKRFYVHQAHQRNGLGTALLRQMITHAAAQNFTALRLDTTRQSPAAISLFHKHGFTEIPRYNDNPRAQLFMELRPIKIPNDDAPARGNIPPS